MLFAGMNSSAFEWDDHGFDTDLIKEFDADLINEFFISLCRFADFVKLLIFDVSSAEYLTFISTKNRF